MGNALAQVDVKLDINSVVSIKVAKVEKDLSLKRDEIQREIADAKKALKADEKRFNEVVRNAVVAKIGAKVEAINAAFKALTVTKGWKLNLSNGAYDANNRKISWSLSAEGFHAYNANGSFDASAEIVELSDSIRAQTDHVTQLGVELADVMKRLTQLSSVERQVRATLAEATLKQTEEGRAMLATIASAKAEEVLGLPLS